MLFWEQTTLDKLGILKSANYIKADSDTFGKYEINFVSYRLVKGNLYVEGLRKYLDTKIKAEPFPIGAVCIKANIGICSSILKKPAYFSHTMAGFVVFRNVCDPLFIKYCFDFSVIQENYKKFILVTNSKHHTTSTKALLLISFPKPPINIQQKIGKIIAEYDLLLENAKKQINLLKNLRQQIFLEWFIKDNFPKDIINSFFDANSSNWKRTPLENIVEFKEGKRLHHEDIFQKGIYPLFTGSKETQKIRTYSYDKEALILSSAGNIRHVKYVSGKFEVMRYIYILAPESKYIFWLLETIERFIALFDKVSVPKTGDIKNFVVPLPPDALLELFNYFAKPIQTKIDNLIKKQEILKKTKSELIEAIYSQNIEIN